MPADPPATASSHAVDALLRARRTRKVLDGARLPGMAPGPGARAAFDAAVGAALAAAGMAPFHYARDEDVPEPWRFTVLDRDALDALARDFAHLMPGKLPRIVAGAGAMVQVAYRAETDPTRRARDPEHHSAAAAAAMSLLIACEARGIGSYWCTASPLDAPALRAWCGMDDGERWLGAIFLGLPLDEDREKSEGFAGKLRARRTPPEAGWVRWFRPTDPA